jgi:hypothetical protein
MLTFDSRIGQVIGRFTRTLLQYVIMICIRSCWGISKRINLKFSEILLLKNLHFEFLFHPASPMNVHPSF